MALDLEPFDTPLSAKALNSQLLAQVAHHTVPITLCLSGNHQEWIRFHIMDCPQTPLVL